MSRPNAPVDAVLRTLVRATIDPSVPVVFSGASPREAAQLARWLAAVHGTPRTVVGACRTPSAPIVVRLPRWALFSVLALPRDPGAPLASAPRRCAVLNVIVNHRR